MTTINPNGLLHSECIQPDNKAKSQIPTRGEELLTLQFIYFMNIYLFYGKHGFFRSIKPKKILNVK